MDSVAKQWTLEELHSLPDDGNKYELIRGALFLTPAPTSGHETVAARLGALLTTYVAAHRLGLVYHPRAVVRLDDSEVEPDLMVRQPPPAAVEVAWENLPLPSLVIEISSRSTWRRDRSEKRTFYIEAGVDEYWIVDAKSRSITVVKPSMPDSVIHDVMQWQPHGVTEALTFEFSEVFGQGIS